MAGVVLSAVAQGNVLEIQPLRCWKAIERNARTVTGSLRIRIGKSGHNARAEKDDRSGLDNVCKGRHIDIVYAD